jgi:hypothetical protein
MNLRVGEVVFLKADHTSIKVGAGGLKGLVAYSATEPIPKLLQARFPLDSLALPPVLHLPTAELPVRTKET